MAWVTVAKDDIVNRWKPLTPAQEIIVATRLPDATDLIELALEDRGIREAPADERWRRLYKATAADMVIRYLQNPDGILSEAVTIDDFREERRRDSTTSAGRVYLSLDELAALIPRRKRRRGAFSIALGNS